MPVPVSTLLKNYCSAVTTGKAALFIGAGMSRPAGLVDWKGFLAPFAKELGWQIKDGDDLISLAQYYLNSKNGERSFLNQALLDEFDRPGAYQTSHEIIAKLPIATIWTTNYDKLIEDAFQSLNTHLDVKIRDKDIGFSRKQCSAVLYKMHGDISQPDKVIICKEDYERYQRTHPVFQHTLTVALLGKTFLFLGLSLDDPNLNYTLGHLCSLLENKKRVHYVVLRNARESWKLPPEEARRKYARRVKEQELRIDDLQRYGIETVLVDKFSEVTKILALIKLRSELFEHLKQRHPKLSEKDLNNILDDCLS